MDDITAAPSTEDDPIADHCMLSLGFNILNLNEENSAPSMESQGLIEAHSTEAQGLIDAPSVADHCMLSHSIQKVPHNVASTSTVQDLTKHHDDQNIPKVGMIFDSEDELYDYFQKYAYQIGFGIRKASTRSKGEGAITYYSLGCAKGGAYLAKTKRVCQLSTKTGCKAKIRVIAYGDGKCAISRVDLEHNHALSPKKSRFQRSNKKMNLYAKRRLELNDYAGIPLNKSFHSLVVEAKGYENLPFGETDCRNYIAKVRQLRLGIGEKYEYLMSCIKLAKDKLNDDSIWSCSNKVSSIPQDAHVSSSITKLLPPLQVRSKGRPPSKRKESRVEKVMKKKRKYYYELLVPIF